MDNRKLELKCSPSWSCVLRGEHDVAIFFNDNKELSESNAKLFVAAVHPDTGYAAMLALLEQVLNQLPQTLDNNAAVIVARKIVEEAK